MKIKTYSYSASPASTCTDKIVNFINKHMRKSTTTSVSYIPYDRLKDFNFGNNGSEKDKKNENKPETQTK